MKIFFYSTILQFDYFISFSIFTFSAPLVCAHKILEGFDFISVSCYSFFLLCLFFAFRCVASKNIIDVLFGLICVFIFSSGCLFCLKAEFLGVIYIMVYVGAIMVLFLFATMLLNFRENSFNNSAILLFYVIFAFFFLTIYQHQFFYVWSIEAQAVFNQTKFNVDFLYLVDFCVEDINIFMDLYTKYSLALILLALILLVVMVGAVSLCLSTKNFTISKKIKKSLRC